MRTVAGICLLATEQPALRRQDLYTGFYRERERMFVDAQKALRESKLIGDCMRASHQFILQLNFTEGKRSNKQSRTKP